jgi:ATP-dependent DNA ligase
VLQLLLGLALRVVPQHALDGGGELTAHRAPPEKLSYAGKVRAGFTPLLRAEVFRRLKPLRTSSCPFVNLPNSAGKTSHWGEGITVEEMETLVAWVKPAVVVEVAFTEWTRDKNLRHAGFVGIREDSRGTRLCGGS